MTQLHYRCMAPDFYATKLHIRIIMLIYEIIVSINVYPPGHGVSFHPLLLSFDLQITYRKVRNLQIDVDKLVEKC